MLPLEGITVVSIEQAVAAPFCATRLADAGATVIKVERPEGDFARAYDANIKGQSSYFVWLNRGKKSVVIDLASDEGRKQLETLIADADVLLQNLKPGALDKLGFARERLRKDYPKLIMCSISGYGDSGPYAQRKAYDLLIQAESGLCSVTGSAGRNDARRHFRGRYLHRRDRARGDPRGVVRALAHRSGRRHSRLDVRRDGRLDVGAAAQHRSRQAAAAHGPVASLDRALRRVPLEGRQGHPDLDPERARVEGVLRDRHGRRKRSPTIRASATWLRA